MFRSAIRDSVNSVRIRKYWWIIKKQKQKKKKKKEKKQKNLVAHRLCKTPCTVKAMNSKFRQTAKKVWVEWNIRSAVIVSLLFQVVLIFTAGSRKRSVSGVLTGLIWTIYLMTDWTALYALGLISSGQANECPKSFAVGKELAAFWAPFLLLHLGGPDAITAFSLEDNELWIRHLFGFITQLCLVMYVFFQSYPNREFMIPIFLVTLTGACKYGERTYALRKASLGYFKTSLLPDPDAGSNYAQLMEEYSVMEASHIPVHIDIVNEPERGNHRSSAGVGVVSEQVTLSRMEIVSNGYKYFSIFKGIIVDHMFSFQERNESRAFFFRLKAADAFSVLEVELNFMYDALYTKMAVVNSKFLYVLRVVCTVLICACLQQFMSNPYKHKIALSDVIITYILIGGALFLDLVAYLNLAFSDWGTLLANQFAIPASLISNRRRRPRWSNVMSQHSFITFCLKQRSTFKWLDTIADAIGMKEYLDELRHMKSTSCQESLKEFIFDELKAKAHEAKTNKITKEIYSARGERVLSKYPVISCHMNSYPSISSSLSGQHSEYDESVLTWHVATELCYFVTTDQSSNNPNRQFCKSLSDYMLYLLVMRPTLMSAVAGIVQIRFADTCEEAKKFFQRWHSELLSKSMGGQTSKEFIISEKLLSVKTVVKPKQVKGDRSKSVLFDACILANELKKLDTNIPWEMMCKVWVELLSYAASHCRADEHAKQLSHGGELITFVWLQMAHFGLGEQFGIEVGHARAKLLVNK